LQGRCPGALLFRTEPANRPQHEEENDSKGAKCELAPLTHCRPPPTHCRPPSAQCRPPSHGRRITDECVRNVHRSDGLTRRGAAVG
jgi:hypothetical protein